MSSEAYIYDPLYTCLTANLTAVLRAYRPTIHSPGQEDVDELHMALHTALRAGGVPMGELVVNTPRIDPSDRLDLIDALMALEPDALTGDFEVDQVKWTLGEVGNVWPASIQKEAA